MTRAPHSAVAIDARQRGDVALSVTFPSASRLLRDLIRVGIVPATAALMSSNPVSYWIPGWT